MDLIVYFLSTFCSGLVAGAALIAWRNHKSEVSYLLNTIKSDVESLHVRIEQITSK